MTRDRMILFCKLLVLVLASTLFSHSSFADDISPTPDESPESISSAGAYLELLDKDFLVALQEKHTGIEVKEISNWKSKPILFSLYYKDCMIHIRREDISSTYIMITPDKKKHPTKGKFTRSEFLEILKGVLCHDSFLDVFAGKDLNTKAEKASPSDKYALFYGYSDGRGAEHYYKVFMCDGYIFITLSRHIPTRPPGVQPEEVSEPSTPYSFSGMSALQKHLGEMLLPPGTGFNISADKISIFDYYDDKTKDPFLFNVMIWPNEKAKLKHIGFLPDISIYFPEEKEEPNYGYIRSSTAVSIYKLLATQSAKALPYFGNVNDFNRLFSKRNAFMKNLDGLILTHEQDFDGNGEINPIWDALDSKKDMVTFNTPSLTESERAGKLYIYYQKRDNGKDERIIARADMVEIASDSKASKFLVRTYAVADITEVYLEQMNDELHSYVIPQKNTIEDSKNNWSVRLEAARLLAQCLGPMTCKFHQFWQHIDRVADIVPKVEKLADKKLEEKALEILQFAEKMHQISPNKKVLDKITAAFDFKRSVSHEK